MNDALMDTAYKTAREHYKAAGIATFQALDSQFASAGFDTVHHAAQRAMRLHIAAMDLAQKVWARQLPYDKAEEILAQQFSEFPAATRQKALSDANTDTR
jgi:hypothetical protein